MTTKDNINTIQAIQNKCVDIISKIKNTESGFREMKIYKIMELIKLQEIKIGYRLVNKLLPNKISQQLQSDSNNKSLIKLHSYNTRGKNIPNLPKVKKIEIHPQLPISIYQTIHVTSHNS